MAASAAPTTWSGKICFRLCSTAWPSPEQGAIDHMTVDHGEAVKLYARHFGGLEPAEWMISGIDAEGLDLACGDRVGRVWFEPPLAAAGDLRLRLVEMAKQARASPG